MNKKKFLVFGNCQANAIQQILNKSKKFLRYFEIITGVKPIHLMNEEDKQSLKKLITAIDVFMYQPTSDFYAPANSKTLTSLLPTSALGISYPICWFNGYFPDMTYIKDEKQRTVRTPIFDYHSKIILSGYISGWSARDTSDAIKQGDIYGRKFILANVERNFERLTRREKDLSIKTCGFVKNNFSKKKLFYCFNHPTSEVIFYIIDELFVLLGLPKAESDLRTRFAGVLSNTEWMITKSVSKNLNLSFDNSNTYRVFNEQYSVDKFVAKYYSYYDANPYIAKINGDKIEPDHFFSKPSGLKKLHRLNTSAAL